jgi:RNA polymerase sigma-70 factor (ECF subfamily)
VLPLKEAQRGARGRATKQRLTRRSSALVRGRPRDGRERRSAWKAWFDKALDLSYPKRVELVRPVDLAEPELERAEARVAPPAQVDLTLLTRAAVAGDEAATRRLLQHISPYVLRVVRAVLGSRHGETEDVVQDVLVNFLRAMPAFRGEASVTTFVSSIAFRRAAETKRRFRDVNRWLSEFQELAQASSSGPSPPSEEALNNLRRELLAQLLSELPKPQSETLVLRLVSGFSIEQIAEATACPLNTVRSRLRLGKEALRSRIDSDPRLRAYLGDKI